LARNPLQIGDDTNPLAGAPFAVGDPTDPMAYADVQNAVSAVDPLTQWLADQRAKSTAGRMTPVVADVSEAAPMSEFERGMRQLLGQPMPPDLAAALERRRQRLDAMPKPDINLSRVPPNQYLSPENRAWRDAPRYLPEQIPLGTSTFRGLTRGDT
jgi:hypothetical protein